MPERAGPAQPVLEDLEALEDRVGKVEFRSHWDQSCGTHLLSIAATVAQALVGGRGVCQDAAQVIITLCRATGLPARYASGHLLGEAARKRGIAAWQTLSAPKTWSPMRSRGAD